MQLSRGALFALLPILNGCYGAIGPTIGFDLATERGTIGVEASGETFTIAHSVALGTPESASSDARPKNWTTHTYFLWEPGLGAPLDAQGTGPYTFLGGGLSAGVRLNRYEDAPPNANFVMGAWASGGRTLTEQSSRECGASDTRPYVALVLGMRGFELYASPKVGVLHTPGFCFSFPE